MKTRNSLRVAGIMLALGLLSYTDDLTRSNVVIETELIQSNVKLKKLGDTRKHVSNNLVSSLQKKLPYQDY